MEEARNLAVEKYNKENLSGENLNTFKNIYKFIASARSIRNFGELAHYDVSLRISKYQDNKYPNCSYLTELYLHRGTLEGAKAIFKAGDMDKSIQNYDIQEGKKNNISCFPFPLNQMPGDHLENLLCLYKEELKEQKIYNNKQKSCIKPKTRKN